jgi:hypothetical protein
LVLWFIEIPHCYASSCHTLGFFRLYKDFILMALLEKYVP